ncbi:hypothetical protein [Rhizobium sp. RAF56]|uniref:hypothetical protein n=1 Tax=Rhizobium sp. RAF56 TaxID=3233062 RepID=UPI003F9D52E5
MGVLESVLASLIGNAEEIGRMERDDAYVMRALLRTAMALAAFAVMVVALDVASVGTPSITDRAATTIATR